MPGKTTTLNLNKPLGSEVVDIDVLNENMDILDTTVKDVQDFMTQTEADLASAEARITALDNAATGIAAEERRRVTAESGRVTAEDTRIANETGRVSAEQARVSAENQRVAAETARVTAEANRVSAETAREQVIEDFVDTTDANKKDAEAYAVGTRGGTDVPDTDPTYHNNAKYYAGQASADAEAAEAAKTTAVSTVETAIGNIRTEGTTQVTAVQTKGTEVLDSIPDDYETLSTDVSALKSQIHLNSWQETVDFESDSGNDVFLIQRIINTSSNWSSFGIGTSYFVFVPDEAKSVTITANDNNVAVLGMLKTAYYGSGTGTKVVFATGAKRTVIAKGTSATFEIPDDCQYLNILNTADNETVYLPSSVIFNCEDITEPETSDLSVSTWQDKMVVIASHFGTTPAGAFASGSESVAISGFVRLPNDNDGKMLELTLPWPIDDTAPNYGVCLYDENRNVIKGRSVACPMGDGRPEGVYTYTARLYLPKNAKYFRTTYWSDSMREERGVPEFTYSIIDIPEEYKPITHELPVDTYMQNAIRRARQLTDIKWTPRVNIPRYSMMNGSDKHFLDWFYADHEYIGIPYSGAGDDETNWSTIKEWGYTHNWVGQHIPIESFVTAARYPNSIFSETADRDYVSYDASPFGDVCTALVNYTVDGPTPLRGITNFFTTGQKNLYRTSNVTIGNMDMNEISIGDFLYTRAHVIFISDLMRDENGNVTHIEMSEETTVGNGNNSILGTKFGGVARRKMWDINEFKTTYASYILFRRTTFFSINYTPSPYVNTGNEGDREVIVDYACIPYLGNGAIYKVGYIHNSKICIGATGFTSLIVTKDGEPFGTFDVTGLTEVSVGFSDAGYYEAYLSDGSSVTRPCHWTVEP